MIKKMIILIIILNMGTMILHVIIGKPILIKSNRIIDFISYFNRIETTGILIYPFAIIRDDLNEKEEERTIKHENIHADQVIYITPIIWYIWYVVEYILNRIIKNLNHKVAYENISFELEAYAYQSDEQYEISLFSWLKFKK